MHHERPTPSPHDRDQRRARDALFIIPCTLQSSCHRDDAIVRLAKPAASTQIGAIPETSADARGWGQFIPHDDGEAHWTRGESDGRGRIDRVDFPRRWAFFFAAGGAQIEERPRMAASNMPTVANSSCDPTASPRARRVTFTLRRAADSRCRAPYRRLRPWDWWRG
jgi:hypothetical protein